MPFSSYSRKPVLIIAAFTVLVVCTPSSEAAASPAPRVQELTARATPPR